MNKLVIGFASALAIMAAGAAVAQTAAVAVDSRPGAVTEARTVKTEGTITAIDAETRMVTLQGAGGNTLEVAAGPEVKNFAQLKVGDIIELEMLEALTVELRKGGKAVVERTVREDAVAAEPGQKPAGAVGHQVHAVADVTAIDAETQTVTLKGARGVVDLKVSDPEQFKLIAVGDQLEATYTQAVAVVVRPKGSAE